MAQLSDIIAKAKEKGISQKTIGAIRCDESAVDLVMDYLEPTADRVMLNANTSFDGFIRYWTEKRNNSYDSPESYMENVNTLYASYFLLRKKLDSSIAFILGDWLLECKKRFFPNCERNRKEAGLWGSFLTEKLCHGFNRTTAFLCMQIARDLSELRGYSMTMSQLKASLSIKAKGIQVGSHLEVMTEKEILSLLEKKKEAEINIPAIYMHKSSIVSLKKQLEKMSSEEWLLQKDHILCLERELNSILSLIHVHIYGAEISVRGAD